MHTKIKMYRTHMVTPILKKVEFKIPDKIRQGASLDAPTSSGDHRIESPPLRPLADANADGDIVITHGDGNNADRGFLHNVIKLWDDLSVKIEKIEEKLEFIDIDDVLLYLGMSVDDGMSMHGAVICLMVALTAHIVIKYILGRRAIFALIGMGVVVYRILKRRRNQIYVQMDKLKQTNEEMRRSVGTGAYKKATVSYDANGCAVAEDKSFLLWHEEKNEKGPTQAVLRPRVRKYEPRTTFKEHSP
jgi:hypothetical protein